MTVKFARGFFLASTFASAALLVTVAPSPARSEPVTITFWNGFAAPENAALLKMIDKYWTPSHPDIKVDVKGEKTVEAIVTALSGGDVPDVVMSPDSESPGLWAQSHALEDISADIAPIKAQLESEIVAPALQWCHQGDTWFALPFVDYNWGLFYNKAMFRAAGLDPEKPPQTTTELADYAKKLTKIENGELTQLGWAPMRDEWSAINFGMVFGAKFLDAQGQPTLNNPGLKAAFDWDVALADSIGRDKVQAFVSGFTQGDSPFKLGKVAMFMDGSWSAAMLKDGPIDFGVAPLPASDLAFARANAVGTNPIVIPRGTHNKAAALEFAKFLALDAHVSAEFASTIANLPQVKSQLSTFTTDPKVRMFAELSNSPNAGAWAPVPFARRYADELASLVGEIENRGTPVEEALAASQATVAGEAKPAP